MKETVTCPYCNTRGNMEVRETGMVCVGKDHYRMYKIKCSRCGKNFWKHENKAEGEKTKWNF